MAEESFRPELVRIEYLEKVRVTHYIICDRNRKPLAVLNLPVPADKQAPLESWEERIRTHVEIC